MIEQTEKTKRGQNVIEYGKNWEKAEKKRGSVQGEEEKESKKSAWNRNDQSLEEVISKVFCF